jgi:2-aminoadipate transaminase
MTQLSGDDLREFYSASANVMTRSLIRELLKLTRRGGIISFAGGLPDPGTFPVEELKQITLDILDAQPQLALQYGPTEGDARLKDELIKWMAKDGITVGRDQILITMGSQQGLDLAGRVFLDPGDAVIVELPSYMAGLQVFRSYRAEMIGVPQDDAGMRTDLLEQTLASLRREGRRPKLIYVVPDFQNPSGVTMTVERRRTLLELARAYGSLVVEDNPYRELRFEGKSAPPLMSLDREGRVIYLSTFSKTLAPGLRIAWMAASEELIRRFVTAKQGVDLCCPSLTQAIAAEYCARGHIYDHLPRITSLYCKKRDVMLRALEREMPAGVEWTKPEGGLFLWVRLPEGMDTEQLLRLAVEDAGVAYVVGSGFHADGGGKNAMRLNFSFPSEAHIEEGIKRLATVVKTHLSATYAPEPSRGPRSP